MLKPQARIADGLYWGLGWGLEEDLQKPAPTRGFWHWGDQDIFKSFALMDTIHGTGIVILTNSANAVPAYEPIISATVGGGHPALSWVQKYS